MKKVLLGLSAIVIAVLLFAGGVYASQWLSFTGDEKIEEAGNSVDEIMDILKKTFDDKELAESELAKIEAELEEVINDGSPGLVKQIKKLKEDKAKLEAELATAKNDLAEEKAKLSKANGTIGDLEDKLETANGTIEGLKTELATANTNLVAKETELSEANKYITHLESELTDANEAVNGHYQKVQQALEEAKQYDSGEQE